MTDLSQESQIKVCDKKPAVLELEPGQYSWCSCGYSFKQPFCDGTHRATATGLRSVKFEIKQKQTVALCMCKQSKNKPFCDGTHKSL